jgi:hypothetical protein
MHEPVNTLLENLNIVLNFMSFKMRERGEGGTEGERGNPKNLIYIYI